MSPDLSHATCALCRRGHDPESPCTAVAGAEAGRIGEIIAERYEITRLLGAGGMGVVYEARHTLIGRRFAVKLLHPQVAQQPSMLTRFQREARAAGSLENEHIAAVTDFGFAADGAPFLVMEHLEGEDLAALLAREGALPIGRAVSLLAQACRGLAAAHAGEIVHRDLKPANLFLTRRSDGADLVKVLDFGIAKLIDAEGTSITGTGKLLGTACYMPPEQAKGDPDLDHRSDIYALGAILYELLTAQKAHPGTNYNAVLFHILTQRSEPVRKLRPEVPPGLEAIVERAMAFERAERYGSVTELAEALRPFLSASASATSRASGPAAPVAAIADTLVSSPTVEKPTARVVVPPRRGRAVVWMAVAIAVAVLAVGARMLTDRAPVEIPRVVQTAPPLVAPVPPTPPSPPALVPPAHEVAVAPVEQIHKVPAPRRKTKPAAAAPGKKPAPGDDFDTRNPYDE